MRSIYHHLLRAIRGSSSAPHSTVAEFLFQMRSFSRNLHPKPYQNPGASTSWCLLGSRICDTRVVRQASNMAAPTGKMAAPTDKMAAPTDKMAAPTDKMAAPTDKMAAPNDKMAAPNDKMAAPNDKMAAPNDKMAAPKDKMAVPTDKMAASTDKMATPADKMAALTNEMVASTNKTALNDTKDHTNTAPEGPQTRVSYLYVPGHLHHKRFPLLVPYLDFDARFSDLEKLSAELKLRGVSDHFGDLETLKKSWEKFSLLKDEVEHLEHLEQKLHASLEGLEPGTKRAEKTEQQITECVARIKELKPILHQMEVAVVPMLLDLPNSLKHSPYPPGEVVLSRHSPPAFQSPPKPNTSIEFLNVSPGAFYLSGDAAEYELLLEHWWGDLLDRHGYLRQSNPDFAKAVVIEGCGYDPLQKLKLAGDSSSPLYLVGGASLPAFLGYFARHAIKKPQKFLPQKLYSCQKMYVPLASARMSSAGLAQEGLSSASGLPEDWLSYSDQGDSIPSNSDGPDGLPSYPDLSEDGPAYSHLPDSTPINPGRPANSTATGGVFASMQSTCVSLLVAGASTNEDEAIQEVTDIVTEAYEKLGLHFRIVRSPYKDLRRYEKDALTVEMLTPTSYVEVGRISVIGDYISKRLLMLHVKDGAKTAEKLAPLSVLYAQLMDVSKFVAVALEQGEGVLERGMGKGH